MGATALEVPADSAPQTKWQRFLEIIWDGERSPEEKRLVQKLDLHLMYVIELSAPHF